jgi:hypothetical protein
MKHLRARLLACAFALLAASGFGLSGAAAQTASPGLVYPPATAPNSFFATLFVSPSASQTLIGPTSSTVVLTSYSFDNWFDQNNGAAASGNLYVYYSNASDCSANAGYAWLARFEAKPGQTYHSAIPGGVTLKPPAPGQYWCLIAATYIQGNPSTYYIPALGYTANLISGSVPPHTATANAQESLPGAVPPIAHRP